MININTIIIGGNITKDPEFPTEKVGKFTVAVNSGFGDNEKTAFMDCVVFGKTKELAERLMSKGMPVIVEGSIQQENWEDKTTGAKRSKISVICNRFYLTDRKASEDSETEEVAASATTEKKPKKF